MAFPDYGKTPVKNVPKKATTYGWDPDSARKAIKANIRQGNLGMPGNAVLPPSPTPWSPPSATVTAPAVTKPASTPGYWNTPDYDALLKGDWEPGEAAIQGQKQRGDAEASFQQSLRRAFIDYGGDVNKLDDKFKQYIDEPTIQAARDNKFSTMAQNLAAQTKSLRQQRAALAGRGLTFSGANTEATRRALEARETADYGAGREFLGGAEEGLGGLSTVDHQIAQMITDAKSRAAARIAQEHPQTWVPGTGPDYEGEAAYADVPAPAATTPPAAAAPWGGISWGGTPGITTKAQLKSKLGYGQTMDWFARTHPDAWAKLK